GAFAAAPLVLYRQGSLMARSEEAPDPARRLHLLMVTHAPDTWFVNLADRTGKHIVDPGPSIDVHVPLFGGAGVGPELMALEFGCEAEFARQKMGQPAPQEGAGAAAVAVYRLRRGDDLIELKLAAGGRPTQAGFYRAGQPKLVIRYDEYARLPENPLLFEKPSGFDYTEARPGR
ncbi:MAG: hypothetical protein ACXWKN_18310, partial [Phenylobacterium sp.]